MIDINHHENQNLSILHDKELLSVTLSVANQKVDMLITQAELEELLQVNNGYRQNIIWEDNNSGSIEVSSPHVDQLTLAT